MISSVVTSVVVTVVNSMVNLRAKISPPTCRSLPIPTPPSTTRAPVIVEIAFVSDKIVAVVPTTRPFLTLKSLLFAISFPFHVTASYIKCIYSKYKLYYS